jgi:hypothetical protein
MGHYTSCSDVLSKFDFQIIDEKNYINFTIQLKNRITYAEFIPRSEKDFANARGSWIELWYSDIFYKLNIKRDTSPLVLCSLEYRRPKSNAFDGDLFQLDTCLLSCNKEKLITFPAHNLPAFNQLRSWKIDRTGFHIKLYLNYIVDGCPQIVVIKEIAQTGFDSLLNLTEYLPAFAGDYSDFDQDIFKSALVRIRFDSKANKEMALIRPYPQLIKVRILSSDKEIEFTSGFVYGGHYLIINNDLCYADGDISEEASQELSKNLEQVNHNFSAGDIPVFFFFEDRDSLKPQRLMLMPNEIRLNSSLEIPYNSIDNVDVTSLNEKLSHVYITYKSGTESEPKKLVLIGPRHSSNIFHESVTAKKVQFIIREFDTPQLYEHYHELKKRNLLVGLFSDVILLDMELNNDITLDNLAKMVSCQTQEEFFKDEETYNNVMKKLILLSLTIPVIKQNFEYLSSYYPYHHFDSDMELISKAFGEKIVQKIKDSERRRIVQISRMNVRKVQADLQRVFSEINGFVIPIEQLYNRENLKNTFWGKFSKKFPALAQGTVFGTIILSGGLGHIGVLASMFVIRELGESLQSIQRDKETSHQVKRAWEGAYSWWLVLKNTLPVTIYEVSDSIKMENMTALKRDHNLFSSLKKEDKIEAKFRLNKELRKQILELTQNSYSELMEGTGVRFEMLESKIGLVINQQFSESIEKIVGSLTFHNPKKILEG